MPENHLTIILQISKELSRASTMIEAIAKDQEENKAEVLELLKSHTDDINMLKGSRQIFIGVCTAIGGLAGLIGFFVSLIVSHLGG